MLEKTDRTVWIVNCMRPHPVGDKYVTEQRKYTDDVHSAFELADEHMEVSGSTIATVLGRSFLIQNDDVDKRVSIAEKPIHTSR